MRLKTFFTSYFLFLAILFITITTISVYMTHHQLDMIRGRSVREYMTISTSLSRDLEAMLERSPENYLSSSTVNSLVNVYANLYQDHYIEISLTTLTEPTRETGEIEISFFDQEGQQFIHISNVLAAPFHTYELHAYFDITDNLSSLTHVWRILLLLFILFSILAAFTLHLILTTIFNPLTVVAMASKKIAGGNYTERISLKGENELSAVATDFNTMAEEIEKQITLLENEAVNKQQFVDNFAHEIRTPLTSIYGYADYMQKANLTEEERIDFNQYIMDEAKHMKDLANSLLELATLRDFTPKKEGVLLKPLLEDLHLTLNPSLTKQEVQFIFQTTVEQMETQEDLLKSLLINLCFNSIKACEPKTGIIHLEVTQHEKSIIFTIKDNGVGIPKDSLEKVMEPFYRVDKSRTRDEGGVGLGLTLCQQIVHVFNGQMTIESEEGLGTEITLVFTTS